MDSIIENTVDLIRNITGRIDDAIGHQDWTMHLQNQHQISIKTDKELFKQNSSLWDLISQLRQESTNLYHVNLFDNEIIIDIHLQHPRPYFHIAREVAAILGIPVVDDEADYYSDFYRDLIVQCIQSKKYLDLPVDLFMNGDNGRIQVTVDNGLLTIPEYGIQEDQFSEGSRVSHLQYLFARILDARNTERLLNLNKDKLEQRYVDLVPEDSDRGYIPILIYRDQDFHVLEPDQDGVFQVQEDYLISLSDEFVVYSFIQDFGYEFLH